MISVSLPLPPSVNNLFSTVGRKRVLSKRYKAWRSEALPLVRMASVAKQISGPYAFSAVVGRPDKRRRDISNLLKAPEDALVEGGAVSDDSECVSLQIAWGGPEVQGMHIVLMPAKDRVPSLDSGIEGEE